MNALKAKLADGQIAIGSWITLGSTGIAEIMARAGFDWLAVDLEHSVISIETAGELIRTIDLCGVAPMVRLTSNHPDQIKRVMDAGAHGVIVPMVNTADDARSAVAATRYAPAGRRGVGLARAQGFGARFPEYLAWQQEGPLVAVMIEHCDALENLREILAVPGVDAYFIGPYDLSCSLGVPGQFEHARFLAAMSRIAAIGIQSGVAPGVHVVEPDLELLGRTVQDGYRFIAFSVDIRFLDVGARQAVKFVERLKP